MTRVVVMTVVALSLAFAFGQPVEQPTTWEYAFFYTQTATGFLWVAEDYTLSRYDENGLAAFADDLADHYQVPDTVRGEGRSRIRVLNIVGSVGWEVVTVRSTGTSMFFYFKRPR